MSPLTCFGFGLKVQPCRSLFLSPALPWRTRQSIALLPVNVITAELFITTDEVPRRVGWEADLICLSQ